MRTALRRCRRLSLSVVATLAAVSLALFVHTDTTLASGRAPWHPGPPWAPLDPKSAEMHQISDLFWIVLVLSAVVFFGVLGVLLYTIFHFSAKGDEQEEPKQIYSHHALEITWTAVPFLVLILAFAFTVKAIHDINTPAKGSKPLDIQAIGHQWWWEFRYPTLGVVTANEVHVPADVPLHFHILSADVVHSFWVPQATRQIDANPGQDNPIFVALNHTGVFPGDCYEYCGDAHAWMRFRLVAQPMPQFKAWVSQQQKPASSGSSTTVSLGGPSAGSIAAGRKVFLSNTCVNCHAISGTPAGGTVGPNLTHFASRWAIGGGATNKTPADLESWIRDPNVIKPGVLMPPYALLTKKDITALTAYLLSLK